MTRIQASVARRRSAITFASSRRAVGLIAAVLAWHLALSPAASAQTGSPNLQHTKNTPDLGLRSDLRVDPSTLAMSIRLPLGDYPGRAGTNMPVELYYSSKVWRIDFDDYVNGNLSNCYNPPPDEVGVECYTTTRALYGEHSVAGWTFSSTFPTIESGGERYSSNGLACCSNDPNQGFYIARLTVRFADGSTHEMRRDDAVHSGADPYTGTYLAVDGSRLKYVSPSQGAGTLYMPDGSRYDFAGGAATRYVDRNGNVLTSELDTLGRQVVTPTFHNGFAHVETNSIPGVGGAPMNYTFDLRELGSAGVLEPDLSTGQVPSLRLVGDMDKFGNNVYANSLFTSPPGSRVINTGTFNPVVLYKLTLPDGSAYTFTYNEYGEIAKVVYPTGGYERYRYGAITPLATIGEPYAQANRGVVERRVSASGAAGDEVTWLYGSNGTQVTTDAPDGTRTVRLLHPAAAFGSVVFGFDDPRTGLAYEELLYGPLSQGSRPMLRRTLTKWEYSGPLPGGQATAKRDPKVTRRVELLLDTGTGNPLAKSARYEYGQPSQPLNVTAVTEYGYVEVARATAEGGQIDDIPAGVALRSTETSYLDDPAYADRNLVGLPTQSTIRAGEPGTNPAPGAVVARTQMSYDESTNSGNDLSLMPCGATQGRDGSVPAARGNVTTVGRWLDSLGAADNASAYLDTHTRYDQCGSVRKSWDAAVRGTVSTRVSEVEYSTDYQCAYPTHTVSPVPDATGQNGSSAALEATSVYDLNTGLILSTTDVNNQTTTGYSYLDPDTGVADPSSRLRKVTRPDGGWTRYDFGNQPNGFFVRTRTAIDASRASDAYQYFDGLGRPSRAYSYDGSAADRTWVAAKTTYDQMGRVAAASNPQFRADLSDFTPTAGTVTTTEYDDLSRVRKVTTPDGAFITTSYGGNTVTVTDQAGKQRSSVSDALGRLTNVVEAPGVADYGYETAYEYDALGNLRKVTQGKAGQTQQTRVFAYDSLSRLTSATNPEVCDQQGTPVPVTYEYDASGNLKRKVDARHVQTDYTYDGLNRLTRRSYSMEAGHTAPAAFVATPEVNYFYDGKGMPSENGVQLPAPDFSQGRLDAVKSSVSETIYTQFDQAGRAKKHRQVVDPGTSGEQKYLMEYGYDLAGDLISEKYPSGRVVVTEYDAAARPAGVKNQATGLYYAGGAATDAANRVQYAAHGAVEAVKLGNGLWEHTSFNSRLQPTQIGLGTSAINSSALQLDYAYGADDTHNNGNVRTQTITVPGVATPYVQTYSYDVLNRLESAEETIGTTSNWRQVYSYDAYGNRTLTTGTTLPAQLDATNNPTISTANNRITSAGYSYDAAGNLLCDPAHACSQTPQFTPYFAYDAEGKLTSAGGSPSVGGSTYSYDGDGRRVEKVVGSVATVFVYDCLGRLVAEYGGAQSQTSGASYVTQDTLGSTRVVTGPSQEVRGRYDYLPFGEEVYAGRQGYGGGDVRQRFTGKERDEETGLDYFLARYYANAQGRFTSVDPLMASGSAGNPQSWNRYAYAFNNPLRFTDPTGMLVGDFYNQDGKLLGRDGINDGKVYVVTDDAQARQIQQADKAGDTTQVSAVSSAIELPDLDVRQAIGNAVDRSNSATADDKNGGFHEEGLMWGTDANGKERIINAAPGAYANPQVDAQAEIEVSKPANPAEAGILTSAPSTAHIHPKGEVQVSEAPKTAPGTTCFGCATKVTTYNFKQPPSTKDIGNALPGTTNVVVGAREKKVYLYDNSGVRATFPLKQFLSIGRK